MLVVVGEDMAAEEWLSDKARRAKYALADYRWAIKNANLSKKHLASLGGDFDAESWYDACDLVDVEGEISFPPRRELVEMVINKLESRRDYHLNELETTTRKFEEAAVAATPFYEGHGIEGKLVLGDRYNIRTVLDVPGGSSLLGPILYTHTIDESDVASYPGGGISFVMETRYRNWNMPMFSDEQYTALGIPKDPGYHFAAMVPDSFALYIQSIHSQEIQFMLESNRSRLVAKTFGNTVEKLVAKEAEKKAARITQIESNPRIHRADRAVHVDAEEASFIDRCTTLMAKVQPAHIGGGPPYIVDAPYPRPGIDGISMRYIRSRYLQEFRESMDKVDLWRLHDVNPPDGDSPHTFCLGRNLKKISERLVRMPPQKELYLAAFKAMDIPAVASQFAKFNIRRD